MDSLGEENRKKRGVAIAYDSMTSISRVCHGTAKH